MVAERVYYTIAQETSVTYGMGDSSNAVRICKEGAYEAQDFPPLFTSKEEAERYLVMNRDLGVKYSIVQLKVVH